MSEERKEIKKGYSPEKLTEVRREIAADGYDSSRITQARVENNRIQKEGYNPQGIIRARDVKKDK